MAQDVIADMVGRLGFQVDESGLEKFERGLGDAQKASDGLGVKAVALGTLLGNLGTKAIDASLGLARMAATASKDLVVGFAESGFELDKWSKKLGITTQELQRLEFAGASVGAEADNVREAYKTLTENLGELARVGSGPAVDSLATLGLTLRDFEGKSATEQLELFAEAMQRLPDDAQRISVALEVMGEDGGALLPLFQRGAAGIEELTQKADRLGVVLDEGAVQAAKDTKLALDQLSAVATGAGNAMAAKLAPKVTEMVTRIQDWYLQNQQIIDQKLDAFVEGLIPAFERAVEIGEDVVETAGDIVSALGGVESAATVAAAGVGIFAVALGGIPGLVAAASVAIGVAISELGGFYDEVERLQNQIEDMEGRTRRLTGGASAGDRLLAAQKSGTLGELSDVEYGRELESYTAALVATGATEQAIERSLSLFDEARERQARPIRERREAEERERSERAQRISAARDLEPELRRRLKKRRPGASDQAIETAVGKYRMAITEGSDTATAAKAAAAALDGTTGRTASTKVDTREAERLLGQEIRALGEASGASAKAVQAALEGAAGQLSGGANLDVARQAAAGVLSSKTGVDLSAQGGVEAALFGQLTQIGGAQAARSATDGARFVNIDQSVNVQVGGITLEIPESYASALSDQQVAGGVERAIQVALQERVFAPIVDAQAARSARP